MLHRGRYDLGVPHFTMSREELADLIRRIDAKPWTPTLSEVRAHAMAAMTHMAAFDSGRAPSVENLSCLTGHFERLAHLTPLD